MAGGAVFDDPPAGPVGDALAVSTSHPILFLPEMALAAHLVTVIHVYFCTGLGYQKITLFLIVTGIAGQRFIRAAMIQTDIAVGHFSRFGDADRFIVMALAAFKAFHLVLAGFRPESPALKRRQHQNRILRQRDDRCGTHLIFKGRIGVFVNPGDAALIGICARP